MTKIKKYKNNLNNFSELIFLCIIFKLIIITLN